jgi:uncharacterized protein
VSRVTSTRDLPTLPAIVHGDVAHLRRAPVRHAFRHRVYQWLVDLDQLPRVPWILRPVAGFHARDHLGGTGPEASADIRANVERFLGERGVRLGDDGRVVMLVNARVLGHVFNPLSVFWCFAGDGTLRCVVAEVHNTYGERHAYLLQPDSDGAAQADKRLYVSPFNDVSGEYRLGFHVSDAQVRVTVSLVHAGDVVFDASFDGVPVPVTPARVASAVLRRPVMPLRVAALIRLHGACLWLRRLPVVDRPVHRPQRGV